MKIIKIKKDINNPNPFNETHIMETRYAIADDNGKIVDDAQGYGYKTYEKASKAMWWKFKDGKKSSDEKIKWWKSHKDLYDAIQDMIMMYCKEIMRGELTDDDICGYAKQIAKDDFNIDLADDMIKFLHTKVAKNI